MKKLVCNHCKKIIAYIFNGNIFVNKIYCEECKNNLKCKKEKRD